MNYYQLLKINKLISNPRIKLLGIWLLHQFNKRYLAVYFDPVMACNLRCKMCYFTDPDYVKKLKGVFKKEDVSFLGNAILGRVLKLQIGCGTEPTLYPHLEEIIKQAKKYQVPYISITTNANLISKESLESWIIAGLNEITVSLHGVLEETYQEMMGKGDYYKFLEVLRSITQLKNKHPHFKLRINYTFNEDNFNELSQFWEVFKDVSIDILQIRPIQHIGNSSYQNFSMDKIIPVYDEIFASLKEHCQNRGVVLLAPLKSQLNSNQSSNSIIRDFTYCYISPNFFWRNDFQWRTETFNQYAKRVGWGKQIFKTILASKKQLKKLENKTLNYEVL